MSHPAWVRGLKQIRFNICLKRKPVAPCVGAWIETIDWLQVYCLNKSHPAWVRGLKRSGSCLAV